MKKLLVIALTFLLFSVSYVYAQDNVKNELNDIQTERNERIEKALLLNLPEISDNPNHIITFKDPAGKGVFLEIDGQGFEEIVSPYTLPSLSLGKHILTFKFADAQDTEQILERNITIIPRPPIINPPQVIDNKIILSGTSISNGKVELFLTRDISNQKALVEVNENGEWEHTFSEDIEEGIYTVIATTRRNGFASYSSEPVVFSVGQTLPTITENTTQKTALTLEDLKTNQQLLIAAVTLFSLGIILTIIITTIFNRISNKKSKKVLQELLKKKTQENLPFKEKFEKTKNGEKEEKEEKVEEKEIKEKEEEEEKKEEKEESEEPEEEAKSLTKEEFLENFKEFDPDDDDGKEKKPKKNIKISLTSKD